MYRHVVACMGDMQSKNEQDKLDNKLDKLSKLENIGNIINKIRKFSECKMPCLAFSGGIDSLTLAALLKLSGIKFEAVTVKTEIISRRSVLNAVNMAKMLGIPHKVLEFNVDKRVLKNDSLRCYYCKKQMIEEIMKLKHFTCIIDGTNFDDLKSYRPGLKAIKEYGVKSPLAEMKLSKKDVRKIAKTLGLPNIPSDSCLATRIEGEITLDKLRIVEKAEDMLIDFLEFIERSERGERGEYRGGDEYREYRYTYTRLRVYLRGKRLLVELKPFNAYLMEKCLNLLKREFSKNFSIECIS